jgi:hypothetical protein
MSHTVTCDESYEQKRSDNKMPSPQKLWGYYLGTLSIHSKHFIITITAMLKDLLFIYLSAVPLTANTRQSLQSN